MVLFAYRSLFYVGANISSAGCKNDFPPEVDKNLPGRYRFFKEIEINWRKKLMMAEFKLADSPVKHSAGSKVLRKA